MNYMKGMLNGQLHLRLLLLRFFRGFSGQSATSHTTQQLRLRPRIATIGRTVGSAVGPLMKAEKEY